MYGPGLIYQNYPAKFYGKYNNSFVLPSQSVVIRRSDIVFSESYPA